ncbi:MAG: hypothetical protein OHK0037_15960 [Elainellaceae cyanobacterium]
MGRLMKQSTTQLLLGSLLLGGLVGLVGCNDAQPPSSSPSASPTASPGSPAPSPPAPSPTASAPETTDPSLFVISAEGIGPAKLGMTLGELKQALPDATFEVRSPFIVDFDAIAVSQNGKPQFYVLYLAGESFGDNDVVQGVLTDNPSYRTDRGVGPGTAIAQAERIYGDATLSYNTQNESREYVRFAQHPASNLSFGTGNGNAETAGIYPSPAADYNETQQFREDATIESVLVICLTDACTATPAP